MRVAFAVPRRFAVPVACGAVRQAIRRSADVQVGDALQLTTRLTSGACHRLGADQVCTLVWPVGLDVGPYGFAGIVVGDRPVTGEDRGVLARSLGFAGLPDMHRFWLGEHGAGLFEGVLIRWAPPIVIAEKEAA